MKDDSMTRDCVTTVPLARSKQGMRLQVQKSDRWDCECDTTRTTVELRTRAPHIQPPPSTTTIELTHL